MLAELVLVAGCWLLQGSRGLRDGVNVEAAELEEEFEGGLGSLSLGLLLMRVCGPFAVDMVHQVVEPVTEGPCAAAGPIEQVSLEVGSRKGGTF